nr:MAG TPA: hypothetical protein [Herelleviridae sp.]
MSSNSYFFTKLSNRHICHIITSIYNITYFIQKCK